jgi:hypothetical protein
VTASAAIAGTRLTAYIAQRLHFTGNNGLNEDVLCYLQAAADNQVAGGTRFLTGMG